MTPTFITGADLLGSWFAEVERGEPPVRFALPDPFAGLDVRPGRMILFGGAPGGGKTAALVQVGIDLLRMNGSARLLVANVEMSPALLVERVASRLSAVPLTSIGDRTLRPDELDRVRSAVASLSPIADRLAFLNPPYSLEHVAAAGTAFGANVLILDSILSQKHLNGRTLFACYMRETKQGELPILVIAKQQGTGGSPMWPMIDTLRPLVEVLSPAFTAPSATTSSLLLLSWLMCLRKKSLLRVGENAHPESPPDRSRRHELDTFYNFFERSAWTPSGLAHRVGTLILSRLSFTGCVTLLVDDTLLHKTGRSVWGLGWFRDAVASTRKRVATASGHNWVVVAIAFCWSSRNSGEAFIGESQLKRLKRGGSVANSRGSDGG